jgi:hypothetical protein
MLLYINEQEQKMELKSGDHVRVEYQFNRFFTGRVVEVDARSFFKWAYVRPDDSRYISSFGASRDMARGYKGYIFDDEVLGKVTLLND